MNIIIPKIPQNKRNYMVIVHARKDNIIQGYYWLEIKAY